MSTHRYSSAAAALLIVAALASPVVVGQSIQPPASTHTPPPPEIARADDRTNSRYRITQSDILDLQFPYVPEFSETVTVQPDGYIALKNAGDVLAAGRTVAELQSLLVERYRSVLRDPVVNVILKEFEKPYFMVTGEVAHPGKYELRGRTTLTQALIVAGGHTRAARHSQVVLFRKSTSDWIEVLQVDVKKLYGSRDLREDPLVGPGDTVLVPRSVLGTIAPIIARASLGFYLNPFQQ